MKSLPNWKEQNHIALEGLDALKASLKRNNLVILSKFDVKDAKSELPKEENKP
jgi:hypothetical protein